MTHLREGTTQPRMQSHSSQSQHLQLKGVCEHKPKHFRFHPTPLIFHHPRWTPVVIRTCFNRLANAQHRVAVNKFNMLQDLSLVLLQVRNSQLRSLSREEPAARTRALLLVKLLSEVPIEKRGHGKLGTTLSTFAPGEGQGCNTESLKVCAGSWLAEYSQSK